MTDDDRPQIKIAAISDPYIICALAHDADGNASMSDVTIMAISAVANFMLARAPEDMSAHATITMKDGRKVLLVASFEEAPKKRACTWRFWSKGREEAE